MLRKQNKRKWNKKLEETENNLENNATGKQKSSE